jgi:hypothetical protein
MISVSVTPCGATYGSSAGVSGVLEHAASTPIKVSELATASPRFTRPFMVVAPTFLRLTVPSERVPR